MYISKIRETTNGDLKNVHRIATVFYEGAASGKDSETVIEILHAPLGRTGSLFHFQSVLLSPKSPDMILQPKIADQLVVFRSPERYHLRRFKRNNPVRRGYQTGSITMQLS